MKFNIAIDGPAGAGKSTIAKRVAAQLGFMYVDTGAMYRTIAVYLLREQVDCENEALLAQALDNISIGMKYGDGQQRMLLNGEDVTGLIRTQEVGQMASISSAKAIVREKLLALQRGLAAEHDVIMDGRDIGTRILPDAELKIYLTASTEARARRRFLELEQKGEHPSLEQIEAEIRERDTRDMNRSVAPLKQAEDAVLVDSSDMSIEQVTDRIVSLAKEKMQWK